MPPTNAYDPLPTTDHLPVVEKVACPDNLAPNALPEQEKAAPSSSSAGQATGPFQPVPTTPPRGESSETCLQPLPTVSGYAIENVLGRGGMGVVYKARHLALKRTVALKMVLASGHASAQEMTRFRFEAEAVARLQHPNIVQIHEVGAADGHPYCVLEFIEGGSLAQKLGGQPLPARAAAKLVELLAQAMQLAHSRNVVHRDLKPANVLLTADGTPKVTDFGLARQLDCDSGETQAGAIMGTPSYMAPEQASGRTHDAGPAADIYALGAILYECVAGRPPFRGQTVAETLEQVRTQEPVPPSRWQAKAPVDLETICLKCLRKEPERRYTSAAALADDLRRFLNGEPIQARSVGQAERVLRWCQRNPVVAALLAFVALLLVGLAVGSAIAAVVFNGQRESAESARNQAIQAEAEKTNKLWESYLDRAVAGRLSRQAGQRFASLAALEKAARIRFDMRLRNEAVACLALADVRLAEGTPFPAGVRPWVWQGSNNSAQGPVTGVRATYQTRQLKLLAWDGTPRWQQNLPRCDGLLFSPDEQLLAVYDAHLMKVRLYQVASGKERNNLEHPAGVYRMEFSPAGDLLLTNSFDAITRLWAPRSGRLLVQADGVVLGPFSSDGRLLAGAGKAWAVSDGAECRALYHGLETGPASPYGPWFVTFSQDGRLLASAGFDGVRLWDVTDGRELALVPDSTAKSAAFHPDGSLFVGSGGLWETNAGHGSLWQWPVRYEDDRIHLGPPREVCPVHFTRPGVVSKIAFRISSAGQLVVNESPTKQLLFFSPGPAVNHTRPVRLPSTDPVSFLAMSPDGRLLAGTPYLVGGATTIRIWDAGGRQLHALGSGTMGTLAFTPDGEWLVSGTLKEYRFYRSGTWESGLVIPRKSNLPGWCAFSPDGRLMAVMPSNLVVQLVSPATGEELTTLTPPDRGVISSLAFSPRGDKLAVCTESGFVYLWDLRSVWTKLAEIGLADGLPPLPTARPLAGPPGRIRAVIDQATKY